jgi:TolB-like protein/DNA-binding winged helix-turn-helix (wHTH) protein/Tfp pilus assembly protein PilF
VQAVASSPTSAGIICFGEFEADTRSRELVRNGSRVRLPDQAFQVLAILLERPGDLVTREEIQRELWPSDTFVDFDHGLNNAVNRLREALEDSADSPQFIETLPRRGYRFVGTARRKQRTAFTTQPSTLSAEDLTRPHILVAERRLGRSYVWIAIAIAIVMSAFLVINKFLIENGGSPASIRSLAVLPLDNLSGDPAQDYFADGMTDALITDLAKIGSLRVISRTSAMTYKNRRKPISEVARELNVDAVVEGSVVRSGNRVRINAQLILARPERHIWANSYERDVANVVALQGEVAQAIAREIQIRLTEREQMHLEVNQPVNPEAYNEYLLARDFLFRADKGNLDQARRHFEQAIHLDPNYAPAWAGLADAYRLLGGGAFMPAADAEQKSRLAVERAIESDPDLAEAHAALGSIQTYIDWNWAAADASFRRALALEPGNVSALTGAARLDIILGRAPDALQLARNAVERNPLDPRSYRVLAHSARFAGQLDEALDALNKAVQLNPNSPLTHLELGSVYLAKSQPQQALAEMDQEKGPEYRLTGLAMAYHALGKRRESDEALTDLINRYGRVAAFQVAEAYAFRGEADHVIYWLERAYTQRDGALVGVKANPVFKSLHGDPRYTAFLKKMGLPTE